MKIYKGGKSLKVISKTNYCLVKYFEPNFQQFQKFLLKMDLFKLVIFRSNLNFVKFKFRLILYQITH